MRDELERAVWAPWRALGLPGGPPRVRLEDGLDAYVRRAAELERERATAADSDREAFDRRRAELDDALDVVTGRSVAEAFAGRDGTGLHVPFDFRGLEFCAEQMAMVAALVGQARGRGQDLHVILSVADEAQNQAIVVLREGPVRAGNPTFGVTCDGWVLDLVTEPLVLSDGHDVTLWLWPTLVAGARAAMPEFLNEEARDWMTAHYGAGLRAGVRRLAIGDTSTPYSVRCAACRRSYEVTYELSRCWHCQAEVRAVWAG